MARRAARVDTNQAEIVAELRIRGFRVLHLHMVGNGCPDILIAKHGYQVLVEIKTPSAMKKRDQGLTSAEVLFFQMWPGAAIIGFNADQIESEFSQLQNPDR